MMLRTVKVAELAGGRGCKHMGAWPVVAPLDGVGGERQRELGVSCLEGLLDLREVV